MTKTKTTDAAFVKELSRIISASQPEDGVSVSELVEATGMHRGRICAALKKAIADGRVVTFRAWRQTISGVSRRQPVYRLAKGEKRR